jgi:predicted HTH transcriptional regulator
MKEISLATFVKDYKAATGHALTQKKLKNLGLIYCDHEQLYPTHAAILLCDSIKRKQLFPNAKIECARFKGTNTQVFIDQATVDRPIHACVEPCIAFVKKNTRLASKIGEIFREDKWEYPLEAMREALGNAVIHRNYSILGSDIKLAIFDDMLEITSPVPLPDTISIEELGTGRSEIRNRILAPIFKDLKIIEAWGTGIQKIKQALKYYPEIELVMHEVGRAFQIQFQKRTAKMHQVGTKSALSAGQFKILKNSIEPVPIQKLLEICNRSDRTKFRKAILNPLIESGLVEMTKPEAPRSPKQKYVITQKGKELLKQHKK